MKIRKSVLTLALVLVLVFSFAAGAAAAGTRELISVFLDPGITIRYNGEEQVMKDAAGTRVYPIMNNGTTYLPIRAVSNMLGISVDWDGATQTVILGEKKDGTDLFDTYKAYFFGWKCAQIQTKDKQNKDISGINCSHWIELYTWSASPDDTKEISFNIGGEYDTVTFKYYCDKDITLRLLGDNDYVLWEKEIKGGQVAQTAVDVKLLKTTELTFQKVEKAYDTESTVYVFDATLK